MPIFLKNSLSARSLANETGAVPVVVEPLDGHTEAEVLAWLHASGANDVETLAPRYISARVSLDRAESLEAIARVTLKRRKEPSKLEPS